ncbi:MAG TPA: hypothetical protein VLG49_05585 [Rhabdochlamydiaceae bacterium]|nr:hypothetical protein [Rhabdochlamydiaceae bacterium]
MESKTRFWKLFSDSSLEEKIQFWSLIGPFLLVASSFISCFKFSSSDWSMLLVSCLGILSCWKWKLRGAMISLAALMIAVFFESMHRGTNELFWVMTLGGSLAMGLLVTAFSLKHASSFLRTNLEESEHVHQKLEHVQKLLKETQIFAIQEKKESLKDIESMKMKVQESGTEAESYKKLLETYQYELQKLRADNEASNQELNKFRKEKEEHDRQMQLLDELNEARIDQFQMEILEDAPYQNNEDKEIELKVLREKLERITDDLKMATSQEFWIDDNEISEEMGKNPQIEKVYIQLKQQFQDKSEILNETRKELFHVENTLLALQKECEQNTIDLNPEEITLTNHLKEVEEECKDLENQVECLQELVTELIGKKKTRKSRKAKLFDKANLELTFD